jgi:hypothetical protein
VDSFKGVPRREGSATGISSSIKPLSYSRAVAVLVAITCDQQEWRDEMRLYERKGKSERERERGRRQGESQTLVHDAISNMVERVIGGLTPPENGGAAPKVKSPN